MIAGLVLTATAAEAQSLRGSSASLTRQNHQARLHEFSYLTSPHDVREFVLAGLLVPVKDNPHFDLVSVSYPYTRPAVKLFLERLGQAYFEACGERLVVTSLVRPEAAQPRNASDRSVHPTGMAVDLRRTTDRNCRRWIERTLLDLERRGLVEATYERHPPHYHVAVFPRPYLRFIGVSREELRVTPPDSSSLPKISEYKVRPGDSLWTIAEKFGTTVAAIRAENGLRSSRVVVGQVLRIPEGM